MKRTFLLFAAMAIASPLAIAQVSDEATVDLTVTLIEPVMINASNNEINFGSIVIPTSGYVSSYNSGDTQGGDAQTDDVPTRGYFTVTGEPSTTYTLEIKRVTTDAPSGVMIDAVSVECHDTMNFPLYGESLSFASDFAVGVPEGCGLDGVGLSEVLINPRLRIESTARGGSGIAGGSMTVTVAYE